MGEPKAAVAMKQPPPPPPPPAPGGDIVKLDAWADPPPGAGLTTVTVAVPAPAMSAAVIDTVNWDEETKVVGRGELFQRTSAVLTKLLPLTVSANAALPAGAVTGFKLLITGSGLIIAKLTAVEVPPPGAGLTTVMEAVPAPAISGAVMTAVNWDEETKVVGRGKLFQRTSAVLTKPLPLTFSVNAALPAGAVAGIKLLITGSGLIIAKLTAVEVPPPGAGLTTVMEAVPALTISAAVMDAVNWDEEINVVDRGELFQWTSDVFTKRLPLTVSVNADPPA